MYDTEPEGEPNNKTDTVYHNCSVSFIPPRWSWDEERAVRTQPSVTAREAECGLAESTVRMPEGGDVTGKLTIPLQYAY